MKYFISIIFFFTSLLSLYSCVNNNNQASVNLSEKETLPIVRFDQDLYNYLKSPDNKAKEKLKSEYGDFLNAFGSVVINNPDYNSDGYFLSLEKYFSNPMLSEIYRDVLSTFGDITPYEKELTKANDLIAQYFEGKKLPKLYMHVSGFKTNTIILQDIISISADRYLGSGYPVYQEFFEDYQRVQMQPEMMVRDYLKAWLMDEIPTNNKRKDLLSEMIRQGKIIYALQQLLPEWDEADLLGYTSEQMNWAKNSEKGIWKTTVQGNYLFSTDYMTIVKYLDEAPYTAIISIESPGRLGVWIGWQIVKRYAENSNKNLSSVLKEMDSQAILKVSKYNP